MLHKKVERPRVVIVGGGFGGLAAARELARSDAEVLLVDKQNHHLFQPLLYQVATAALSPANIAAPIRKILAGQRNCQVAMAEVTAVDLAGSTVRIGQRPYVFDYLVLAAGACTNYFGRDEWAESAPGLKTIDEAVDVRSRFLCAFEQAELETDTAARRAALTFAVVGGGPTGVEMAGALAEISRHTLRHDFRTLDTGRARIILIDAGKRLLTGFSEVLSDRARRDLESLGVEVMLETLVTDVGPATVTVEQEGRRRTIEANNVVWAAGVKAVEIGDLSEVEHDSMRRIVVGEDLTIAGFPHVFVVGDMAHRIDPVSGEPVPGVAQGAMQMGRYAGRVIAREIDAGHRGADHPRREPFVYRDKGMMATIGRNKAVAEVAGLRLGGIVAFGLWAFVHVLFLIDFRSRLFTLGEWIWMYFFYERGVRLITGKGAIPRPTRPPEDPRLGGDSA